MTAQQLSYASANRDGMRAAGGWGVLQRSPALANDVEERLVAGVSVAMAPSVSAFPTVAELTERPVRFRYEPDGSGGWLVWRSVEAGADHTNRPGNVFTHAACLNGMVGLRPIDLYDSPDWLSPYGPEQVGRALLPNDVRPPQQMGIRGVLRWLHEDREHRVGAAPWVVDVALQALLRGHQVFLRVPTTGDARGWIGLLSWLLPQRAAAMVALSTLEDPTSIVRFDRSRRAVVAVSDQKALERVAGNLVALDPTWSVPERSVGESNHWLLPDGASVPRSGWSSIAMDLAWLPETVGELVIQQRDAVAESLSSQALARPDAEFGWAEVALRAGLLLARGAVVVGRGAAIRDLLGSPELTSFVEGTPELHPLAREVGWSAGPPPTRRGSPAPDSPGDVQVNVQPSPGVSFEKHYPEPTEGGTSVHDGNVSSTASSGTDAAKSTVPALSPKAMISAPPERTAQSDTVDLLDEYAYPTPRSAVAAAATLQRYTSVEQLLHPRQWVSHLNELPAEGRLALLHLVAQDPRLAPAPGPAFDNLMNRLVTDSVSERMELALVLLGAWSDVMHPASGHFGARVHSTWFESLAYGISLLDRPDLDYLSFHFSPITLRANGRAPAAEVVVKQIQRWTVAPPRGSVWGMKSCTGLTLARIVSDCLTLPRTVMS